MAKNESKKSSGISQEQRHMRRNQIIFAILSLIMVIMMIISLVKF
ncbi:MAG TPA: hypothetical protein VIO61_02785 [Anaerolineaceae bacterium]